VDRSAGRDALVDALVDGGGHPLQELLNQSRLSTGTQVIANGQLHRDVVGTDGDGTAPIRCW